MKITVEKHSVVGSKLFGKHFGIIYGGMKEFRGIGPPSIEIDSQYVATVISIDHTIGVQHGHYFEHELFSQGLCFFASWLEQKVYDTLHHERGVGFTRVHTPRHEYHLLIRWYLVHIIGDSQYIACVALDGLAQFLNLECVFHGSQTFISLFLQGKYVVLEIGVRVGLEVRKEHDVIVVFKGVAER